MSRSIMQLNLYRNDGLALQGLVEVLMRGSYIILLALCSTNVSHRSHPEQVDDYSDVSSSR